MNGIGVLALILSLFIAIYFYQQKEIDYVKKTIIPKMEKKLNASYHDSSFLTTTKLNSLKIFKHQVSDIESFGYFQNDIKVIEYIKILFIKKDTEENDIENILFDGKVIIENGNNLFIHSKKPEYFEAGENLINPKKRDYDKKYSFFDEDRLF